MLKFVIIGIFIIGIFAFVLWNLWKMTLLKHKYFGESITKFQVIEQFKDVPQKLQNIKKEKTKTIIIAALSSVMALLIAVAYFGISRVIHLNNHEHSYKEEIITASTCIEEGEAKQECRYCSYSRNTSVKLSDHTYTETNYKEPNCTDNGKITYTCEICGDVKTEKIPINGEHNFELISYSNKDSSDLGYCRYTCNECNEEKISLSVDDFNGRVVFAIAVLIIGFVTIIIALIREGRRYIFSAPPFWIALVAQILAILFLVLHFAVIVPMSEKGNLTFTKISKSVPTAECELLEKTKLEPTYSTHGEVTYECLGCRKEFLEYLPYKEIDPKDKDILIYEEPTYTEKDEMEYNNDMSSATDLPLSTRITGNLSSIEDVDYFDFELPFNGNILFEFSYDVNPNEDNWIGTIYDANGYVLHEDYISSEDFMAYNVSAGTYYLKISVVSNGTTENSIYTNSNYQVVFKPQCAEHQNIKEYFREKPTCEYNATVIRICEDCGWLDSEITRKGLEHKLSNWETTKEATIISPATKTQVCKVCDTTFYDEEMTYWWVLPLAIAELITLLAFTILFFKKPKLHVLPIVSQLTLSVASSLGILTTPIFNNIWDSIALGLVLALNLALVAEHSALLIQRIAKRYYYIYKICSVVWAVVFAIALVLGLTIFNAHPFVSAIIMAAIMIRTIMLAVTTYKKRAIPWMITNIVVAVLSVISAVVLIFIV